MILFLKGNKDKDRFNTTVFFFFVEQLFYTAQFSPTFQSQSSKLNNLTLNPITCVVIKIDGDASKTEQKKAKFILVLEKKTHQITILCCLNANTVWRHHLDKVGIPLF